MKKILSLYLTLVVVLLGVFIFQGCSELKDNVVTAPVVAFHGAGWNTEGHENFHGKHISDNKWGMEDCQRCHGTDFKGGSSGSSCYKCHSSGPKSCNVCHGSSAGIFPPEALNGSTSVSFIGVGVHSIHLSRDSSLRYSAGVRCVACHVKLTSYDDTNHIGPNPDNIAEVKFDSLAVMSTPGFTPNPVWDRTNATCANSYCHGNFRGGNPNQTPVWTEPNSSYCGSCHGTGINQPRPPNHFIGIQCNFCHNKVVRSDTTIYNKSLHLNGVIDFNLPPE